MQIDLTAQDLIKFEEEIVALFEDKKIRAPFHLDNNNEKSLISIFRDYVDEADWVTGSWRMHYRCLLKGVPINVLKDAILAGKSIGLCFPKYKIIASAIVGGGLPISVGIAMGIKRQGGNNKVVCFMGDMTSETGIAHECIKYSTNHKLPILWVIEDNGKSVCTDTREVWNTRKLSYEPEDYNGGVVKVAENILYYRYESKYPHAGGLSRVQF